MGPAPPEDGAVAGDPAEAAVAQESAQGEEVGEVLGPGGDDVGVEVGEVVQEVP